MADPSVPLTAEAIHNLVKDWDRSAWPDGIDEILVMDHGKIVERGNHRSLLEQAGLYAQMWAMQQQEDAEPESTGEQQ